MKTEKTILYIILGLLALNLFNQQCGSSKATTKPKITVVRDTVWQTKTDTFKIQTTNYKTVYVAKDNMAQISSGKSKNLDTSKVIKARVYRDTLRNTDMDIFSYNLVDGQLLDSEISYNLKVPREITVSKTIEHPKTYRSGLYLFSEVGGNQNTFNNLSLGLQYNRKGKWFVSYRANVNSPQQTTHNVGVGLRLFK